MWQENLLNFQGCPLGGRTHNTWNQALCNVRRLEVSFCGVKLSAECTGFSNLHKYWRHLFPFISFH